MPCDHNAGNRWEAARLRGETFAHVLSLGRELNRFDALDGQIRSQNQFRCPVDQAICGPEVVAETAWSNVFLSQPENT
jgi:hypothetical protein